MSLRHYQPGDEAAQVAIYNIAAAPLPKFKPAVAQEIQRRVRARDFDPRTRLYAVEADKVVGYCAVHANGRVSFPWCLPGHESHAEELFQASIDGAKARGLRHLFAAYRQDWTIVNDFFLHQSFTHARDVVNFFVNFFDMPTPSSVPGRSVSAITPADIEAIAALYPGLVRMRGPDLERHLLHNPYFTSESLFGLRSRLDNRLLGVGILVTDVTYADPEALDSQMPCFRLAAFGAEGMQVKRVNGMFSFTAPPDKSLAAVGVELMGQAAYRMRDSDTASGLAAQAPSDAPALIDFYQRYFRRQGSFPVFERALN